MTRRIELLCLILAAVSCLQIGTQLRTCEDVAKPLVQPRTAEAASQLSPIGYAAIYEGSTGGTVDIITDGVYVTWINSTLANHDGTILVGGAGTGLITVGASGAGTYCIAAKYTALGGNSQVIEACLFIVRSGEYHEMDGGESNMTMDNPAKASRGGVMATTSAIAGDAFCLRWKNVGANTDIDTHFTTLRAFRLGP